MLNDWRRYIFVLIFKNYGNDIIIKLRNDAINLYDEIIDKTLEELC